jgi:hypothetical protein
MFSVSPVGLHVFSEMPSPSKRTVAASKATWMYLFLTLMDELMLSQMRLKLESALTLGKATLVGSYVNLTSVREYYLDLHGSSGGLSSLRGTYTSCYILWNSPGRDKVWDPFFVSKIVRKTEAYNHVTELKVLASRKSRRFYLFFTCAFVWPEILLKSGIIFFGILQNP